MIPTILLGGLGMAGGGSISRQTADPADPYWTSVYMLAHFDGANGSTTLVDSSLAAVTLTATNGAALSTAQVKFGTASLFLDGTNDYVSSSRTTNVGAGAFTIEAQVRPTIAQIGRIVSCQNPAAPNAIITLRTETDGTLRFLLRSTAGGSLIQVASAAGAVPMDGSAWKHVAATRDGSGNIALWVDGVSVATGSSTVSPNGAGVGYMLGSQYATAEFFGGYIDEVRITEGVCR